jgi:L-ascorbate metabolism protein UlaG (beta-lactamase superfamily)
MNRLRLENVEIEYLSHSGFVIRAGGRSVAIDPFLTNNRLAKLKPADIRAGEIIVTHGHADHIGDAAEIAKLNKCRIIAGANVGNFLQAQGADVDWIAAGGTLKREWGTAHARYAILAH